MAKPIIEVQDISKCYQLGAIGATRLRDDLERVWHRITGQSEKADEKEFWALRDVSFEVQPGEIVGIIGRNGAGKSTLLKILSRITEPTSGEILMRGRVASLLEVGTGFHGDLTGRENIFLNGAILGMSKAEIRNKLDEIIAFAEIEKFIDTPVKRYSSGMYVRLAFAVAAHLEPEILIVDEVLAVGDASFQKKCIGKMQDVSQGGLTVIFVSHNMGTVQQLCSRAIVLQRGQVQIIGSTAEALNVYSKSSAAKSGYVDCQPIVREGSGDVRFSSLRILDAAGNLNTDFSMGDDLVLEVSLKRQRPVNTIRFSIHISTIEGIKLASVIDFDSGFSFKNPDEKEVVRIRFKDLRFYPGNYLFSLWIGNAAGASFDTFDKLDDCLQFEISNGGNLTTRNLPKSSGLLFMTPEWERIKI
jgi:lipopolysaccharide transport system ATP-binding protein